MAVIQVKEHDNTVMITIRDRFDFSSHKEFMAGYKGRESAVKYIIDLQDVQYIDSSALGMLVLLREHTLEQGGSVSIINCNGDIRKILMIANFHNLFNIQ